MVASTSTLNMREIAMELRECCFKSVPKEGRKLVWEITHKCTWGCDYCFQAKKRIHNTVRVLNATDLSEICSKLDALAVTEVLLTGGEIYHVRDMLPHICNELAKQNLPISFSTNEFARKDFINLLLSFKPTAVNISLEPSGNGTSKGYDRLLEAAEYVLDLAGKNRTTVKITGVITKSNIKNYSEYLDQMKAWTKQYSSLSSVYITNPYDIGYISTGIRANLDQLEDIVKKAPGGNDYPAIKYVNFHRFNMPLQYCYAGSKYVHLEPNGNIYPCHLFANLNPDVFMLGNLLSDSPNEIADYLSRFAAQTVSGVEEYKAKTPECEKCTYSSRCGAGCLAEIISMGNLIEPRLVCKRIQPSKRTPLYTPPPQLALDSSPPIPDLLPKEEERIVEEVKMNLRKRDNDLAHRLDHVESVVHLARFIGSREGANLRIVTAAAYFHDFEPRQPLIYESHTELSAKKAVDFLKRLGFSDNDLARIYHCIDTSSYGSSQLGHSPETIEAKVVRDADWLDAIGARGIARVFAFASAHGDETLGKCEWDPENPPKKRMSLIGPDPSPIYHFFSKLLWVKDGMMTETGRQIAQIRHARLVKFLQEYRSEMDERSLLDKF